MKYTNDLMILSVSVNKSRNVLFNMITLICSLAVYTYKTLIYCLAVYTYNSSHNIKPNLLSRTQLLNIKQSIKIEIYKSYINSIK